MAGLLQTRSSVTWATCERFLAYLRRHRVVLVSYMPLANSGPRNRSRGIEPGAPTAAETTCFYLAPSVRSSIRRSICLARLAPSEIQAARRISSKLCRRKAAKRHRRDPKLPPPSRTAKRHRRQQPWPSSRSTSAPCRSSSSTPTRASSRTRSSNYLCGNQPVRRVHRSSGEEPVSPRHRAGVDGVEVDETIQRERAVKFDFHTGNYMPDIRA